MAPQVSIGQFEQLVLTAILQCGRNAYGVKIHESVETLSGGRSVALGAAYATLDRLEDKGLISSWLSDPTPERGGRSAVLPVGNRRRSALCVTRYLPRDAHLRGNGGEHGEGGLWTGK